MIAAVCEDVRYVKEDRPGRSSRVAYFPEGHIGIRVIDGRHTSIDIDFKVVLAFDVGDVDFFHFILEAEFFEDDADFAE